jgi:molybdopterin/thiamine biosynthesis adenylyltransferase
MKIRQSLSVLQGTNEGEYIFIFTNIRMIKKYKLNKLAEKVLLFVIKKKEVAEEEIIKGVKESKEEVIEIIQQFLNSGILMEDESKLFNKNYYQRYKRQISFLGELSTSAQETKIFQEKLKNARVIVFGIGGIGTWIVNGLSQIGIGEIVIVDPDIIEISNLNRQLFFTTKDIGRYKVDVVKKKLPDSNIITYIKKISKTEDLTEIIKGSSIIINCADNPSVEETTRIISGYCNKYKIPYSIAGGYNMHLGMLGPIIIPEETACFECFLTAQKERDHLSSLNKLKDIEQTGSLGPIAGMIANFHVMEILKFLIGKGKINKNKFAEIDFMNFNITWLTFEKCKNCKCNNQK